MAVLPIRWQGRQRSEQLRQMLEARCEVWRSAWATASAPTGRIALLEHDALSLADAGEVWLDARNGDGHLYARIARPAIAKLGAELLGLEPSGAEELALGIGYRATTDLVRLLADDKGVSSKVVDERPDVPLASLHGVLKLAWTFGAARVEIYLDAVMCDLLLPKQAAPISALTSRREAIQPEMVVLEARLDLGPTGLHEVLSLRPGDLVKTRVRIDAPLHVRLPGGRQVFSGTLLADQAQRAVRCHEIFQETRK